MTASLTHDELLALAASARLMMRVDGELTEGELAYAERMGAELGLDRATWTAVWDEAVRRHPDRRALQRAADLARPEAQDIVYEHLYRLAERDDLVDAEWDVLEWLDATWKSS
ncbi:MAG: hypothetical protein CMN30_19265 [Sandaracinus sp.]|nr:hypothetical protein [Sandaracinus sp.]|tara:strand:+ start:84 stop:422 length:339 start_codon:yes stop_codon:yes gene_type:complete